MYYYQPEPSLTLNLALIAAAVVPALILMYIIYKLDRLEKESSHVLFQLAKAGVFSALLAMIEERVLCAVLNAALVPGSVLYNVILYFGIVAFAEESSKYLLLKRNSWNFGEFNCKFDGVIYAVFVALGFALWENISYVLIYGFGTALVRAVTAIPGHACFGVFMGVFYALAKENELMGYHEQSGKYRLLAVFVPALLHGAYDYIATSGSLVGSGVFLVFIAAMFAVSFHLVRKMSREDKYM